jgi:hypothetical protein
VSLWSKSRYLHKTQPDLRDSVSQAQEEVFYEPAFQFDQIFIVDRVTNRGRWHLAKHERVQTGEFALKHQTGRL